MKKIIFISALSFALSSTQAQQTVSKAWVADMGNGNYKNPIIHADYSDPDAIRVGTDYYMISSSFNQAPGIPILHSKDLVNWKLIGHALNKLIPEDHFSKVQHGGGVWAPAIRFYNNEFYIYYPDPDFGIYLIKAKNISGPWSEPLLVEAGKGLIDPCPLWDNDGKVYLVHAYAGSRAGIKSIIVVKELNKEGTKVISNTVMVYDGHEKDPTIEGPKFYKRNGYYYIFAPAGGVSTGWQTILRSKNIYGPYERKVVMDQGTTTVNGPHQGAWITTQTGEDWFLHFQDKEAYGRVAHLQPMKWINDWPVIGTDKDGDGKGEPVSVYKKPNIGKIYPAVTPPESDDFNSTKIGLQWQWQAYPKQGWAFTTSLGYLRMFSVFKNDSLQSVWDYPNILAQKFPAEEFSAAVKLDFKPRHEQERFGFIIQGSDYAFLSLQKRIEGNFITFNQCYNADKGGVESETTIQQFSHSTIYLRIKIKSGAICEFSFSEDGKNFSNAGNSFTAKPGKWVGARIGMFFSRKNNTNDAGFADIDWFRVEPVN